VTRSRAYKKNDQAFVEQKNGAIVRRLVGYGRFEGIDAARSLARLFAAARLHINFFQPSFKLKEKHRDGASPRERARGTDITSRKYGTFGFYGWFRPFFCGLGAGFRDRGRAEARTRRIGAVCRTLQTASTREIRPCSSVRTWME
jgi:hypothetical protein